MSNQSNPYNNPYNQSQYGQNSYNPQYNNNQTPENDLFNLPDIIDGTAKYMGNIPQQTNSNQNAPKNPYAQSSTNNYTSYHPEPTNTNNTGGNPNNYQQQSIYKNPYSNQQSTVQNPYGSQPPNPYGSQPPNPYSSQPPNPYDNKPPTSNNPGPIPHRSNPGAYNNPRDNQDDHTSYGVANNLSPAPYQQNNN